MTAGTGTVVGPLTTVGSLKALDSLSTRGNRPVTTMERIVRAMRRRVRRARAVERFVRLIVAGGIALVAGLWLVTIAGDWSLPWLLGVAVILAGTGALAAGIRSEIET